MLIQLKESEIKVALQNYIVAQGISLVGKTVDISFTAGRKESGISADLDIIDDVSFDRFAAVAPATAAVKVSEVAELYLTKVSGEAMPQGTAQAPADEIDLPFTPAEDLAQASAEAQEAAPAATTSSLFGS